MKKIAKCQSNVVENEFFNVTDDINSDVSALSVNLSSVNSSIVDIKNRIQNNSESVETKFMEIDSSILEVNNSLTELNSSIYDSFINVNSSINDIKSSVLNIESELLDLNDEYDHLIIATDAGTFCQNSRNMQPGEKHYEYRAPFTGKQIASQYVTRELRTNDNKYLQHIRRFDDGEIILWNETVNDIYTFNPNTFELNILPITIGSSNRILDIIKINNNYHIFGLYEDKIYYKIRGEKHEDPEVSYLSVNSISITLGTPLTCKIYNYESAKFIYISYADHDSKEHDAYRGIYKWNETKNMFELSIEEFSKLSNRINVITTGDGNIINDFDCAFTEIDGHIYGACALSYGSFPSLFEYLPKYNCVKELVNIPYNGLYVNACPPL